MTNIQTARFTRTIKIPIVVRVIADSPEEAKEIVELALVSPENLMPPKCLYVQEAEATTEDEVHKVEEGWDRDLENKPQQVLVSASGTWWKPRGWR